MTRGLWTLVWLEIKIFVREPLGVIGTVGVPVLVFLVIGQLLGERLRRAPRPEAARLSVDVPVLASILIALSAVLSLVTIIAIYREGGILKRLRATPLRPYTILTAHVIVKLLFTALTLFLMVLAGRRYYPIDASVPLASFAAALLFTTVCIVSVGFVIASLVPTARFAQPAASLLLYPMLSVSGLFVPTDALPPALQTVARVLPLTYAVSFLQGVWRGDSWSAHLGDIAVLLLVFLACAALSTKVFRWE